MADSLVNYTYAQGNYGAPGGDNSGTLPELGVVQTSWPGQVAMNPNPTLPGDNLAYNTNKFNITAGWPDSTQPTGPAIDPTGVQKGEGGTNFAGVSNQG